MVLDASAMADLLLQQPLAERVRGLLACAAGDLHAPHLLDLEVLQVLRRNVLAGRLELERAEQARGSLSRFPLQRHAHHGLEARIWDLRHTMTAYDASYVALAAVLGCPLLTTDGRLARAAAGIVQLALPIR